MMFGHLPLLKPAARSIRVDTHTGNAVENDIALAVDDRGRRLYEAVRQKHPGWKNRRKAAGVYNCFGLAFASRRTSIREDVEVEKIRTDDGYRKLKMHERPAPGDLVVYKTPTGALIHVALVTRLERLIPGAEPTATMALSKWNDHFGEDEHEVHDHPFGEQEPTFEFWTDRPLHT